MTNFQAKDAGGSTRDFKAGGSGTSGDPFIPEHNVNVTSPLPAGTNKIGAIDVESFPALPAGTNTIGKLDQGAGGASAWKVDGSGVTQPVSGTFWPATQPVSIAATVAISAESLPLPTGAATSAKQDTGNTSLSSIDSKITACDTGAVTVASSALPTGAATGAKQDTSNASLASIDGKITACNTGSVTIASSALPTGAATETTLSGINSKLDTLDDIVKTEDAAHASGDKGVMLLAVRNDPGTVLAGTTGDYIPLSTDDQGALRVTSTGGGGGAGTEYTEGATDTTITGTAMLAEGPSDTLTPIQLDASGNLKVAGAFYQATQPISAASLPLPAGAATSAKQDTGNSSLASIDGKMTACNTGAVTISSALPAGTNNIGDVDVLTLPNVTLAAGTNTNEMVGDVAHDAAIAGNPVTIGGVASAAAPANVSADQDAVRAWFLRNGAQATVLTAAGALIGGDAANGLDVDVTRLPAINAGGDVAHDAADSGNPLKIGGVARTANPTSVANGDRVDAFFDKAGKQIVEPFAPADLSLSATVDVTGTTETDLLAAGGAGVFQDLTHLTITNASGTATVVSLRDAATGTVRAKYAIAANGGIVINWTTPKRQTTANNKWTIQSSAAVNLSINVDGVKRA